MLVVQPTYSMYIYSVSADHSLKHVHLACLEVFRHPRGTAAPALLFVECVPSCSPCLGNKKELHTVAIKTSGEKATVGDSMFAGASLVPSPFSRSGRRKGAGHETTGASCHNDVICARSHKARPHSHCACVKELLHWVWIFYQHSLANGAAISQYAPLLDVFHNDV